MKQSIVQKLKDWRAQKSRDEHVEIFKILHNKTIEEISEILPRTQEEFVAIKGLGGKKFGKYGYEILNIIRECTGLDVEQPEDLFSMDDQVQENQFSENVLSVSQYLDLVNSLLNPVRVSVRGEISEFKFNKHAYFSIRDTKDGSVLSCFMWSSDYEICSIDAKDGLEIIVHGYGDIYKPSGRMSLRCMTMELVGEGALQKAYEELKKKLTEEGIFAPERKKTLPLLPIRLGVITSKHGAVINDLASNLGRFGYHIRLYDSRVEGALAIKDLHKAIQFFRTEPIDLLVVIRGGGSLESLQAFNNETLIRAILDYPVPVICGIGHDKDVPLFSLAADLAVSTPTAVAREINRSWESAIEKIRFYESNMINQFIPILTKAKGIIEKSILQSELFYQKVQEVVSRFKQEIVEIMNKFHFLTEKWATKQSDLTKQILTQFSMKLEIISTLIDHNEKEIQKSNPEKQLKLGYSILFSKEKVIKSIQQVSLEEKINIYVTDGEIISTIKEIISKE